jgi:hypothetical protein
MPVTVTVAAGSVQADATQIKSHGISMVHCTGANATKGVKLPGATKGKILFLKNSDAANAVLKVWPKSGDAINALGANNALSMAAKTAAVFVALDGTTWFTFSLLPS